MYLNSGCGAAALLEAGLGRVKPRDLLVGGHAEAGARPGPWVNRGHVYIGSPVPGRRAADPPLGLLEDSIVIWDGGELLADHGLPQLGEHLHHKGADLGVGLVRELDPLVVPHLVGVNERLGEMNVWFAYGRFMKSTLS